MRVYVKSAGRQPSQEYVWNFCDASGEDDKTDLELLSLAEKSASNRGRVASFVADAGTSSSHFVLFFGNVDSGRCDFTGTPILNRLGLVFDAESEEDFHAAQNLAADWYSEASALEGILSVGIVAVDGGCGFTVAHDFCDIVRRIASVLPSTKQRRDADQELFASIKGMQRLSHRLKDCCLNKHNDSSQKGSQMKIYINTVPSGESDYGWYVGGRPPYADKLCDICEHVAAVSAEAAFFAALSREQGAWIVFVQDIIGRDLRTMRPARGTIAIEIPDSDTNAAEKARRLLYTWLLPNGKLLNVIKRFVDVSGDEVKADMPSLLGAVEAMGTDSSVKLCESSMPQMRIIKRIDKTRSNIDSLRTESAKFVADHSFLKSSGVQFLFTNSAYSLCPDSYDAMPDIPAKYIVAGFCEEKQENKKPDPPFPIPVGVIIAIALGAVALLWLLWPKKQDAASTPPLQEKQISTNMTDNVRR